LFGIHGFTGVGYDDGVYLGAATRLVHGVLPYRDFDFLHPPGITILMAPDALLGRLIGTRDAMALARCLTALVTGLNAALAALAMRDRGKVAMAVAGGSLALFPLAVAADQSLLLEPYLVCFCLLGVIALFSHGDLASSRRVLLAGIAFGFATCIKVWGVLPVIVVLMFCIPRWRRGMRPFLAGLVLGLVVPSLFFVIAAPHAFFHDVVAAQLHRGTSGQDALSIAQRLVQISGLTGLPGINATTGLAVGLFIALAVLVGTVYLTMWRRRSKYDWFLLVTAVVVLVGMFTSAEFYDHYAYFPAAFLALVLGVCASQVNSWIRQVGRLRLFAGKRILIRAAPLLVVAALIVITALLVQQDSTYASNYLSASADPSAALESQIPEGACVVFDYAIFAIEANRFNPAGPGCPAVVDPFGMWLTRNNGQPPPASPPFPAAFTKSWRSWFDSSDYVVLSVPYSDYIPWTPALAQYFSKSFLLRSSQPRTFVYSHSDRMPSAAAQILIRQGSIAFNKGRSADAIRTFQAALALDPADTDAVFDTGVVEQRLGRSSAATKSYERALFLDPQFTSALYNLAVMETSTAPAKAIDLYRRVLRIKPGDANSEFNLGLLLVHSGQNTQGEQFLHAAVVADPSLAARVPPGIKLP
jgi:tetratricopeptide (TPR) repeat protein